ncbi:MAG TPA: FAD-dependent oxidoreductase [Thermoanaerobaculia bacterium]|nr:FAD-dependent oxidoreductase [Thermoanaerobaculia bacterium]
MAFPPIEDACYWMSGRPIAPADPLTGDTEADVAVVGGGFTGFWTALFLKELEPSVSVCVLEGRVAGYGASGRNAGIVGETLDHSHELAIRHFGLDEARELARIGRENLDELERFVADRGIPADFRRPGQLTVALTDAQVSELEASVEAADRVGAAGWRMLSAGEARAEIASPLYRGALLAPRNALVDPVGLVAGLREEARRSGVRVYERTPVETIRAAGDGVLVESAACRVRARRAVLATNAYSHQLVPRLAMRFLPLYDYVLVSRPLTPPEHAAIGWARGQGVVDARTFFNYYRPTADGRILFGTSEAAYYPGNRVAEACDHSPARYASLRESFRRHFPELATLEFPYAWGGPIASTTRLTPFFGTLEGRIAYALGYTGHGIGSTRVAGRILAYLTLERPSPFLDLAMVRRKPFPFPPEPLRRAAVSLVTRSLRRVDAGGRPGLILRALDALGIGFSS